MTREEKEKLIRHLKYNLEIGADYLITDKDAIEIIKALEQEPVLDKIKAEIRNEQNMDYKCHRKTYENCLRIIDKYRTESEDKKWN